MAAPKRNRTHPNDPAYERTVEKIRSSQLVNALIDHVLGQNGREDMKSTQVTAALGLIKKVLPDLQSTELVGDLTHTHENIDLSSLDVSELKNLERTLAKVTNTETGTSGDSETESNKLH